MGNRKHGGALRISRPSHSHKGDYVSITLEDTLSGRHVIDIEVPLEDFARAVFGSGADCAYRRYAGGSAVREIKTERVAVPSGKYFSHANDRDRDEYLTPYEVDGWRASRDDLGNSHRASRDGDTTTYAVGFVRFIPPAYQADWPNVSVNGAYGGGVIEGAVVNVFERDAVLFGEIETGPGRMVPVFKRPAEPWRVRDHDAPRP